MGCSTIPYLQNPRRLFRRTDMGPPISPIDRFRIAHAVWTFDTLVGDLPRRRRLEIRRELRANLHTSAAELGGPEALRRLGSLRRLANGYLDAEFGDQAPRPHWEKGLVWALGAELVLLLSTFAGLAAFTDGVEAAGPAVGSYTWAPLGWWGPQYKLSMDTAGFTGFSLEISGGMLTFLLVLSVAFFLGGRMWRALPPWRGRPQTTTAVG
jgi:hypothetical protein